MNIAPQHLIETAHKYFTALIRRDVEYLVANSIDEPGDAYCGINSVPGGLHSLSSTIDHLRSLPPAKFIDLTLSGYTAGEFAWLSGAGFGVIPSGEKLAVRVTLVLYLADQVWKVVHYHVSEGVDRYV